MASTRSRKFRYLPTENERLRELIGIGSASLELLVAVLSCESALGITPTRKEVAEFLDVSSVTATELLNHGYIDISAKGKLNAKLIATRRAWREFGFATNEGRP